MFVKLDFSAFGVAIGLKSSEPKTIELKNGESIIISIWSWRKFAYIKKLIQLEDDGDVRVTLL